MRPAMHFEMGAGSPNSTSALWIRDSGVAQDASAKAPAAARTTLCSERAVIVGRLAI